VLVVNAVNEAFRSAVTNNAYYAVELMLKYADDLQLTPYTMEEALFIACDLGFAAIVHLLGKNTSPILDVTLLQALGVANKSGQQEAIKQLLQLRDRKWAARHLKSFILDDLHQVLWVLTRNPKLNLRIEHNDIQRAAECEHCSGALTALLAAPNQGFDAVRRAGGTLVLNRNVGALHRYLSHKNAFSVSEDVIQDLFTTAAFNVAFARTDDALEKAEAVTDEFMKLPWQRLAPDTVENVLKSVVGSPLPPAPENFIQYLATQNHKAIPSFNPALVGALAQRSVARAAELVRFTLKVAPAGTVDVAAADNLLLKTVLKLYSKLPKDTPENPTISFDTAFFSAEIVAMFVEYAARTDCKTLALAANGFAPLFMLARGGMPDEATVARLAEDGFTHYVDALQYAIDYLETVAEPRVAVPRQICEQLLSVSMLSEANWAYPHSVNVQYLVNSGRVSREFYAKVHKMWETKTQRERAKGSTSTGGGV
jgi:hypothetical protein